MPTTTTGKASEFITFSRTSNATVTDSDGKIKWAPHNLLLASEQFDASNWTKYLAPITANAQVAPNGTTTADTVTTSDNYSSVNQTLAVLTGATYTFAFYAKRGTMTDAKLSVRDVNNAADIVAATSYYSATNSSTWSLVTQTFTVPAGCTTITVHALKESFATGTIHLWGAHLYRSDLGGMKANTSAYPMYNPTTPKNLLGFSEDFTQGVGVAYGTTCVSNVATAPNGLMTADELKEDGSASNFHYMVRSIATVANSTYVLSGYFRANTSSYVILSVANFATSSLYASASFNLTSGALVSASAVGAGYSIVGTPTITAVGSSGWYRCAVVVTAGTTAPTTFAVGLTDDGTYSNYGLKAYNGSFKSIYGWGIQVSDSASLDAYVPNNGPAPTAAAYYGPRLDADPVTLSQRGLLVEESRTNLILYNRDFSQTSWVKTDCTASAHNVSDPNGTSTASTITATATNGYFYFNSASNPTGSVTVTSSMWIKRRTGSGAVYMRVNADSGGETAITVTASWQRISVQVVAAAINAGNNLFVMRIATSGDAVDIWLPQCEVGAFMTSVIPTGAATATRAADVASVSTSQFPYSASEGTLVLAHDFLNPTQSTAYYYPGSIGDAQSSPYMVMGFYGDGTPITQVPTTSLGTSLGFTNSVSKIGIAFTGSSQSGSRDGSSASSSSMTSTLSSANLIRIAGSMYGLGNYSGHIRQITYLPRRITNAELQARTT